MKSDCYALFDLAQWKNGLAFKKIDFSSDGEPVIKIAELKNGITGQTQFTEGDYGDEVHLTKGDMLFSWSGNPETSIDVFWYNLPDGWLNQHIFKVIPKPFVDRNFLYYLLKSLKATFTAIASNKQTTGLGHITLKDLKKLNIALPSEKEQKIIGRYLYTIDQKISVNQAINDNLTCLN
ncbi:restriction endonuclease subunit S [Proteus mirabilis]|uniref:restriction endonuclease subunit S n=1 Tax=Proteus mirabilis TaxID=584 RepID=UPI00163D9242|nr:restriction endonuclease subunit S [Proteus mirabilis]EKV3642191.1 restriction endonuclease subunit S [Proteus mirabilis]ELB2032398.1 restriction endonuclease subunit S [Proteus mirabilis]ELF4174075.1 restriction endonuclease subunit S [Proteus mirabilis]MDM3717555.1 restriction endonuclease subunit S [Proteus mirabilis]WQI16662.1 restriction endonuclease subunit S [Proteus mirabilis]